MQPSIYLPSAARRALLRWHADDQRRRDLLLHPCPQPQPPVLTARSQLIAVKGAGAYLKGTPSAVAGLSAPDAQTVRISILQPTGYFLDQLVGIYLVNRKAVEQYGSSWADHGGGTGPFKIKSVTHVQWMVLIPNTCWYGGKVQLSKVDIPFILSASAAYNAYQTPQPGPAGPSPFTFRSRG